MWSFFARTNHERTKLPFRPALSPHPHAHRYLFCLGRKICAPFKNQPFQRRQLHASLVSNTERACHKFRFVCVQNGSRFHLCHPFVGVVQEQQSQMAGGPPKKAQTNLQITIDGTGRSISNQKRKGPPKHSPVDRWGCSRKCVTHLCLGDIWGHFFISCETRLVYLAVVICFGGISCHSDNKKGRETRADACLSPIVAKRVGRCRWHHPRIM
jgi:hypothetical protein